MIFNKNIQYGLLFVLYLCQAGRATVETTSENLGLSKLFLYQIARKLKTAGVIRAVRGPGGGYEITGDPTVRDVFNALQKQSYIDQNDLDALIIGTPEQRALANYIVMFKKVTNLNMNNRIKSIFGNTIDKEKTYLDNLSADRLVS